MKIVAISYISPTVGHQLLLVVVMVAVVVLVRVGRLLDDRRLGGARCTTGTDHRLARVRQFSRGDGNESQQGRARRPLQRLTYLSAHAIPGR